VAHRSQDVKARTICRMRARRFAPPSRGFRHEAFLYADAGSYAEQMAAFLRAGLAASEPVMAAVPADRLRELRVALGADADDVLLADMAEVGRNPARIIPEWRRFVDAAAGRPMRGVGEPLWAGRGRQEALECHLHEWLLPRAFVEDPRLWLVCAYDVSGLDAADIDVARRLHPARFDVDDIERGPDPGPDLTAVADPPGPGDLLLAADPFPADDHLPPAVHDVVVDLFFGNGDLEEVRDRAVAAATGAGLESYRAKELTLAVHEIASNALRHADGAGRLRVWAAGPGIEGPAAVVCEVSDTGNALGPIADPMVGRVRPATGSDSGRGLWLANQLCDLVQLRTSRSGTVVRLHVLLPAGRG
jgi:anti-sigma regulatory factor (Ser/Thr protein kinase)